MSYPIERNEGCIVIRERSTTDFSEDIQFVVNYFGWAAAKFQYPKQLWHETCQDCGSHPIKNDPMVCKNCPYPINKYCAPCWKPHRHITSYVGIYEAADGYKRCSSCYHTFVENEQMFECDQCEYDYEQTILCENCLPKHNSVHTAKKEEHMYNYHVIAAHVVDRNKNKFVYVIGEDDEPNGTVDAHYYLKAYDDGVLVADWELESYNPYFGCSVYYLEWFNNDGNNNVVLAYSEKHGTFCVSIEPVDLLTAIKIPLKSTPIGSQPGKYKRDAIYNIHKKIQVRPIGYDIKVSKWSRTVLSFNIERSIELPSLKVIRAGDSKEFLEDSEHTTYYRNRYDSQCPVDDMTTKIGLRLGWDYDCLKHFSRNINGLDLATPLATPQVQPTKN